MSEQMLENLKRLKKAYPRVYDKKPIKVSEEVMDEWRKYWEEKFPDEIRIIRKFWSKKE